MDLVLTRIKLFNDEFNLSVHIRLVIFDKTSQDFFHTLKQNDSNKIILKLALSLEYVSWIELI